MYKIKKYFSIIMAVVMLVTILFATISVKNLSASAAETVATTDPEIKIAANSALLMNYESGKVAYAMNENKRAPIASMVKIMTLINIMEEIESGNISLDSDIVASEYSTSMGGSQAFLDTNCTYKASELIKSIIVASANDSCVAMAEHISGSVKTFVARMNEKAAKLGMDNTYFVNCTGLPAPNQYSSALDVAKMSRELFGYDNFFTFSKIPLFDFVHPSGRVTMLTNTNKLIRGLNGCDGGKTGFTNEAKSCLSATAKRGDMRMISVVIGAADSKTRNKEVAALMNYGFSNFACKTIVAEGEMVIENAAVNGGKDKSVGIVAQKGVSVFDKKNVPQNITRDIKLDDINAPIRTGDIVGTLTIKNGDTIVDTVNLLSSGDISVREYGDILSDFINNW